MHLVNSLKGESNNFTDNTYILLKSESFDNAILAFWLA